MEVKFTEEQKNAIETLDKSVLVSAAAGSGKTAVLVQRIINIILSGKADVDEMLVVTFTKAAAAEMRLKLAKAIKKRMQDDPGSRDKLRKQLNKLYKSYISTFDSFAVRVIKEFFYEIDIEPNFKACDEVQSELMQREALDSLLEEAFADGELIAGLSFPAFMRLYSKERNENDFKDDMLKAYAKLRSIPDYWNWAFDQTENLRVSKENFGQSVVAEAILADAEHELDIAWKAINEVKELFETHDIGFKFGEMLGDEYTMIETLRGKAIRREWNDDFAEKMQNLEWADLNSYTKFFVPKSEDSIKKIYAGFKKEVTALRNIYKDSNKGNLVHLRNRYFLPDIDTRIEEMNATFEYTQYYLRLMQAFEERYQALKQDAGLLDFADMEHIAVRILDRPVPSDTLRRRFKYIFIDEYQDTNNIQEHLISCFARDDNVFKVGDVKQSIYRFRQAEPGIFEETYEDYSSSNNKAAISIDLNKNFRSNSRTIDYINAVFEHIMEGYDDRAKLYTDSKSEYDFTPEVHVLTKEGWDEDEPNPVTDDTDDEIESLSTEEAEAKYIAELVRDTIGTEFCDTKTGEIRQATARDIVILFRAVKTRGEVMARALRNVEVQSHIEEDDNYFDTVEIGIALSLFTCIDNMKRDIPLIATLHSEIFGWTPEELARVRIACCDHRMPYWEAVKWYSENGDDEALKAKVQHAYAKISEWRELSNMMPTADFIWKVLVDSGYYLYAGAMYDGDRRQANLRVLVDRARQYSEGSVASLSSFLRFIEVMKTKKISNGQVSMVSKEDDVVRISTIHKSKGLEYPFVIVGGLGHKFRKDNNEMNLSFDSRLGVAMPYVSPDRKYWRSSLLQRAINAKSANESYKEELRVLYVAMTRARNKLIMVGTTDSEEKLMQFSANPSCYLKAMREVLDTDHNEYYLKPLDKADNAGSSTRIQALLATRSKKLSAEAETLYAEIDRRLSYTYPDSDLLTARSKYSVSAIRREELQAEDEGKAAAADTEVVNLWHFTDDRKKASASDIGIAYHRIMEYIDFARAAEDLEYIDECAHFLTDNGAIDEEVFKAVDTEKIADFFRSDVGRRAAAADNLSKEKAFTLATEWKGREILVQGVIDCCWEEIDADGNRHMILVDYKSNFINPSKDHNAELERIRHEYKTQIEMYSRAIEEGTGIPVAEAYLYLFATSEFVAVCATTGQS